jgi:hypothetical protein
VRASDGSTREEFADGEYLMRKGGQGDVMHVVRQGTLRVPIYDQTG